MSDSLSALMSQLEHYHRENDRLRGQLEARLSELVEIQIVLEVLAHQRRTVRFGALPAPENTASPYVQVDGGQVYRGDTTRQALVTWAHQNDLLTDDVARQTMGSLMAAMLGWKA